MVKNKIVIDTRRKLSALGGYNLKNISAAILCGGKNRRMGSKNKAFLEVEDIPIIERQLGVIENIFEEIIIVTNRPDDYSRYQKRCRVITDIFKDIGPLGGIHAAISQTNVKSVFFIACDMPFLHNEIVWEQIHLFQKIDCEALIPKFDKLIEPLHAIYQTSIAGKLESFIKSSSNYAIRNFLDIIDVFYWNLTYSNTNRQVFENINTTEDFKIANLKA